MKPSFLQHLETDPDATARRLMQRAHNRDGLPEVFIGAIFLTTAFFIWLQVAYPRGSFAYRASSWGMMLLVAPMIGLAQVVIKWVRRRFLIEKVGYVEPKPLPKKRLIAATCVGFIVAAALVYGAYVRALPPRSWMIAGIGIAGGILAAYAGRLPRYVIGGILMALTGIGLAFSRISFEMGSLILYSSAGVLALVSGCVVFLHFLNMRDEEAD